MSLGHTGGDGADAHLGHQLDADPGVDVGILQVVDQLGQIFDGIDVVVRRRGKPVSYTNLSLTMNRKGEIYE